MFNEVPTRGDVSIFLTSIYKKKKILQSMGEIALLFLYHSGRRIESFPLNFVNIIRK